MKRRIGDYAWLVLAAVACYGLGVLVFLIGFLVTPNGYPTRAMFEASQPYVELAKTLQTFYPVVLAGSLLGGFVLLARNTTLRRASRVMFAINGIWWALIAGTYVARALAVAAAAGPRPPPGARRTERLRSGGAYGRPSAQPEARLGTDWVRSGAQPHV